MYKEGDLTERKKGMFELVKESEKNVVVYGVSRGEMISLEDLEEHKVSRFCLGEQECLINVRIYLYKNNV